MSMEAKSSFLQRAALMKPYANINPKSLTNCFFKLGRRLLLGFAE